MVSPWSGGPAAQAGVLERDIVVSADGAPLDLATAEAMSGGALGEPVTLNVRTGARPVRHYVLTLGGDEARALSPSACRMPLSPRT